jgi:hypothetical protein
MTDKKRAQTWYTVALIFTIWFVLTCAVWTYLANVVLSFPAGLLGLLFWRIGRKYDKELKLGRVVLWLLKFGVCFSITMLLLFLLFDR